MTYDLSMGVIVENIKGDVERAIVVATMAHDGQRYGDNKPYILHPLHVMALVQEAGFGESFQIVAVLHDTIEDTDLTEVAIGLLFGHEIAQAVTVLTRGKDESYGAYMDRVEHSVLPEPPVVKFYDSSANLSTVHTIRDLDRQMRLSDRYTKTVGRLWDFRHPVATG